MAHIERFNFKQLQDFGTPEDAVTVIEPSEPVVEEDVAPPPPTYSQAELDAAIAKSRNEGIEEGRTAEKNAQRDAQAQQDKELFGIMERIAKSLAASHQCIEHYVDNKADEMTCLALAVGTKLAADTLKDTAQEAIYYTLEQCIPSLVTHPSLTIRVHPDMEERVSMMFKTLISKHRYEGDCTYKTDPDMHRSDVQIEWQFGKAERSFSGLCASLDHVFADAQQHIAETLQDDQETRVMDAPLNNQTIATKGA